MKIRVSLDVEFSELPDEVREELADGINFRADDDNSVADDLDAVPRVSDMTRDEIISAVSGFFNEMGDYDAQSELWAGSEVYGFISEVQVHDIAVISA